VEFDPTPPDGQGGDEAGVMSSLWRLADAIEFFWQEHIVAYDTQQQVTIWQMFEGQLLAWKRSLVALYQGVSLRLAAFKVQGWAMPGAVVAILIALLLVLGVLLVARRASRFGWLGRGCSRVLNFLLRRRPSYRDSAFLYYDQMQHLLAQKGIVRAPGQTPLELAVSTGLAEVLQLTTAYNRIRFGGGEVSRDEVMRLSETLAALRRQLGLERPHRFLWGRRE
jgi:hypothetical protein